MHRLRASPFGGGVLGGYYFQLLALAVETGGAITGHRELSRWPLFQAPNLAATKRGKWLR
ncbi:hypothetical protein [Mycobacteroides chelonae]|uniref:hypothetical protein n=1 Tax=Mycobacteroides chelonae TaxID=1774 RepID=UPI0007B437C2|nr:hypothetical protein [Mycobacteroides chelonae]ANB00869.1 hypothetical protein BB28_08185 [Mycobacteroides chelonae CCUG 47445]